MKFICNLGARRCNLGQVLEWCRNGDVIVLEVPEAQEWLAQEIAGHLRSHLKGARKEVEVSIGRIYPPVTGAEMRAAAQRIAQRA